MKNLTNAIVENSIKNLAIIIIIIASYNPISNTLAVIPLDQLNNILLVFSMLLLPTCFADFTFTYEKTNMKSPKTKFFGHVAIFTPMLLTAIILEAIAICTKFSSPAIYPLFIVLAVGIYLSVVFFDFWDLLRAYNN